MPENPRLTELTDRTALGVSGPDWRGFLQGILTQDVMGLEPGEARFAALLTPQGRLLSDLFLVGLPEPESVLLDVAADKREALVQRLAMYRLRAQVAIRPTGERVFALWNGAGGPGWASDPRLPELGFRGYGLEPPPAPAAAPATRDDYDALRLELGAPDPAKDCDEASYPIQANFDLLNGIDFRKGCYIGQETTSRMKRRASVKSRMVPIAFDGPAPPRGSEVRAGDLRAGEVLSGRDGAAMALLRLDRAIGADLSVAGRPVRLNPPKWLQSEL